MKAILFLLVTVALTGCTASVVTTTTTYPMNHFQTGKTVGNDSLKQSRLRRTLMSAATQRLPSSTLTIEISPKRESGESSDVRIFQTQQNQPAKATASSGGPTLELATPISVHARNDLIFTLPPIYYALNQNINYAFTPENSGSEEKQSINRRFSAFGVGIGIHAKMLRAEVTLVENLKGSITPFFGLMIAL